MPAGWLTARQFLTVPRCSSCQPLGQFGKGGPVSARRWQRQARSSAASAADPAPPPGRHSGPAHGHRRAPSAEGLDGRGSIPLRLPAYSGYLLDSLGNQYARFSPAAEHVFSTAETSHHMPGARPRRCPPSPLKRPRCAAGDVLDLSRGRPIRQLPLNSAVAHLRTENFTPGKARRSSVRMLEASLPL